MKNSDRPSFPNEIDYSKADIGLTKREYFAGLAMQATITSVHFMESCIKAVKNTDIDTNVAIARTAIEIADELLKQLEK